MISLTVEHVLKDQPEFIGICRAAQSEHSTHRFASEVGNPWLVADWLGAASHPTNQAGCERGFAVDRSFETIRWPVERRPFGNGTRYPRLGLSRGLDRIENARCPE